MFPANLKAEPMLADKLVAMPWLLWFQELGEKLDNVVVTFHAGRNKFSSRNYPNGTMLYETDRNAIFVNINRVWTWTGGEMQGLYADRPTDLQGQDEGFLFFATDYTHRWRWDGTAWTLVDGIMRGTLSPDTKPGLGTADAGFLFNATDFNHTYRWSGTAWEWADPNDCSGSISAFAIAPTSGWALCDGSTVDYALSDGSLDSIALPNLTTGAYLKGGVYDGVVNPASAPGVTGTTSLAGAHNHFVNVTGSASATGSAPASNGAGAFSVASTSHTHGVVASGTSDTDGDHTHTLTLTADATGQPKNALVAWYFRT